MNLAGAMNRTVGGLVLSAFLLTSVSATAQTSPLQITNFHRAIDGWVLGWEHSATGTAYSVLCQDSPADGIWRLARSTNSFPISSYSWLDPVTTNSCRLYQVVGVPIAQRGKLLAASNQGTRSLLELLLIFGVGNIPITPQYSVRQYKIRYETITPWGARTIATGALLLPVNTGRALPLASYQHGTITVTSNAPSRMTVDGEFVVGLAMASTGYAVSMPDYLGLGDSPGLHPFHHARSEATASLDMLRAVKTLCATNGFPLTNRLFLAGYSQGGHATMALCREIETYHTNEFTITACAPMAGAYDLSGVTAANFLAGNPSPNPYYLLYFLAAYQDIYKLGPSLSDLLAPPFDTVLPPLMNGNTSGEDINAVMPSDPVQVLKPEYLAAFRADPRHPLRLAMQDNDVYDWRPRAPMRMYHCAADRDVVAANSQVAWGRFQTLGATQILLFDPLPTADHSGCAEPSFLLVKAWFDSLR